jgi:uncharacterized membrane protein YphA (DoxX/SURF4 family)
MGWARHVALLVGRILIAGVFIYESTVMWRNGVDAGFKYVETGGLPSLSWWLAPVTGDVPVAWRLPGWSWWPALALNAVGGILLVVGLFIRWVAAAFAVFCAMTAVFFHNRLAISNEVFQFGKDLGLAGGFLFLIVTGAGGLSLDAYFRHRYGLM